jgi:hypothetical protein
MFVDFWYLVSVLTSFERHMIIFIDFIYVYMYFFYPEAILALAPL